MNNKDVYNEWLNIFKEHLLTYFHYDLLDNGISEDTFISNAWDVNLMSKFLNAIQEWKWTGKFEILWKFFTYSIDEWNIISYNFYVSENKYNESEDTGIDEILDWGEYKFNNNMTKENIADMLNFIFN